MDSSLLQPVALGAAFWVAVLQFRSDDAGHGSAIRFVFGLALAALAAHLGWALLHADALRAAPAALLAPTGFCVLFAPLGILATAPWRSDRARREAYLADALGVLPLAFAMARLGCVASDCCGPLVAVAFDAAGLVLLHLAVRRVDASSVPPLVLAGFGAIRLAVEPLRASPPLGAPLVAPAWIAAAWVIAAFGWLLVETAYRSDGGGLATSAPAANSPRRST